MVLNFLDSDGRPDRDVEIVRTLRTLRGSRDASFDRIKFALDHIQTTNSTAIRNAAALALADLGALDTVPTSVDVVMKPGVSGSAGMLLYAIEELGGDLPLHAFVHVLINGSYEARQQALDILASGHVVERNPDEADRLFSELDALLSSDDDETSEAARQALAVLRDEPVSAFGRTAALKPSWLVCQIERMRCAAAF